MLGGFKKRNSDIGSVYLVLPEQKTIVKRRRIYPVYVKKVNNLY